MQSLSNVGSTQICPYLNVQRAVAVGLLTTIGTIAYTKFSEEINQFASQAKDYISGLGEKKKERTWISHEEWVERQVNIETEFNKNGKPVIPVDPKECEVALGSYDASAPINEIVDAVGGKKQFCALPVLQWKASFIGGTEYVDGVKPTDLSAPMMRGSDPWSRPHLTLRTEDTVQHDSSIPAEKGAETLFQRYTDKNSYWVSGHHHSKSPIVQSTVDKVELERLQALAAGKSIEMPNWDSKVVVKKLV